MKQDVAMLQIVRTPPTLAARAPVLIAALVLLTLGCREDPTSPTAPESAPALATATMAAAPAFRQVSTGGQHTCGATTDDRAYCWGFNFSGQLGNGTNTGPDRCGVWPCSTRPIAVLGGLRFRHVSAGHSHACGLTRTNRVYCWGHNGNGQLGDGTTTDRLTPTVVAGGRRFRLVRAGSNHTCAITESDLAFCWGGNSQGQLGDGTHSDRPAPVLVAGGLRWRWLSPGAGYSCGVTTDQRAYCWGNNGNGQIGDGSRGSVIRRPVAVAGGLRFREIDTGDAHTCGLTTGDRAYCWGWGGHGQLGDGTAAAARTTPSQAATTHRFSHISAGQTHTCSVSLAGRGFCWGQNRSGQLGNGTTPDRSVPTPFGTGLVLAQVSAGQSYSCGVSTGAQAHCWGINDVGQLGDGTTTNRSRPVPVAGAM